MTAHPTGTREEWLKKRLELLEMEKELTRQSDKLAQKRQELPWVKIEKKYQFDTEDGNVSLIDLFQGRSQLLIYHFMFGPDYTAGCPSCSSIADGLNGIATHLANHDVMLWAISRAPLSKLLAYKQRMDWTFPWASSHGTDFNFDFTGSITEDAQRNGLAEYNYRREPKEIENNSDPVSQVAAMSGTDHSTFTRERPGMSSFALEKGIVYHTYSTYARGLDALWCAYQWLDRAPKGRNETNYWWRRHDEYLKN